MEYIDVLDFWKKQDITNSAQLKAILKSFSFIFAYNSGKIENEEITYYDVKEIFDKNGVTSYTGSTKTLFEIQNSKSAHEEILKLFDKKESITEELLKHIQKVLTAGTYDERRCQLGERPGEYKKHDYVTGKNEVGASVEDVADEIDELLDELSNIDDEKALIAAAYFHAKLENIHPFSDGNGRVGRLMMNYFLLIHNHPPIVIFEEDRKEYYEALEDFDENIKLDKLVEFLKEETIKTWKSIIDNSRKSSSLTDFI